SPLLWQEKQRLFLDQAGTSRFRNSTALASACLPGSVVRLSVRNCVEARVMRMQLDAAVFLSMF
ncbi:MAG: hypothetical protein L0312_23630, partial [Acidobacteria bacterium]|nr:hypothetical protein [Acidobacteriota bacterium]